ncbi:DUF2155 domain-containing protein [Pikeienuella piscinae]|uniref:DUF2155 domain-containing protein n=1 Tax=Pikeienuella piscinae TaxID=2748098 RepID=A0A7L5BSZ8_9RHOB|nr:DUF2155 domain-containing protein [Pikeienuella piscinae]QIE54565.1 DUF2155 domain-containing protein [Pikeienuella piscinae]
MKGTAALSAALALLAAPLFAQETPPESPGAKFVPAPGTTYGERPDAPGYIEELIAEERPDWRSVPQPVALLRGLDKISGRVTDIRAPVGDKVVYERLTIEVDECREPPEGEVADAFVFMKIEDAKLGGGPVFSGWMFASSPALSAMDHQRYDLWVLSCATS